MQNLRQSLGQAICIIGSQWGDEGKGKLVDILSQEYDIIARFAGGANAGHTIYFQDPETGETHKFISHLIPSGILHEGKICLIGNGTVVHLPTLIDEINELRQRFDIKAMDRIVISDRAHLILNYHLEADTLADTSNKIGTTKRGIGPCYTDKITRVGIRACELKDVNQLAHRIRENAERMIKLHKLDIDIEAEITKFRDYAEMIYPMVVDTSHYIDKALQEGKSILIEGAQGTMLDIDHGTYPYLTSSNTTIGGAITGVGIAPKKISHTCGIVKAYTTRVGSGPFPTELESADGEKLREKGGEYGATTGRPRRCGWFDAHIVKYSVRINGLDSINLTKLDVLSGFETLKIGVKYVMDGEEIETMPALSEDLEKCEVEYIEMPGWTEDITNIRKFEELPENAQNYVLKLEELVGAQIKFIGVGMRRDEMIVR